FLDNGPGRRPPKRPIAVSMMLLALTAVFWLTYESAAPVDWKQIAADNQPIHPDEMVEIDTEHPGYAIYENSCLGCHGDSLEGGASGPTLIDMEYSADEIAEIAVDGIGDMPPEMFTGTDEELEQLVDFIMTVNEDGEE